MLDLQINIYFRELLTEKRDNFIRDSDDDTIGPVENMTFETDQNKQDVDAKKPLKISPGPGGINPELLRYGSLKLLDMLTKLFE